MAKKTKTPVSKNIAIILAGGLGSRMGGSIDVPKQFYMLKDKPILIYTLEIFERHPEIDSICVVCLPTWESYLEECAAKYGLKKIKWVTEAGDVRQESVYQGLTAIEKYADPDDVVLVHDGVRMFIGADVISNNIQTARKHGTAMTSIRNSDSLLVSDDSQFSDRAHDRDSVFMVQTPQSYRYGLGLELYRWAYEKGITSSINCCELFVTMGQRVCLVPGLKTNIKITTAEDIEFLHALHTIYSDTARIVR